MQGKIIKGIAGFYYIHLPGDGLYECRAKGGFRNQKLKPLVGDNVIIDILDNDKKKGNVVQILDRMNQLVRPEVSNVDQAVVIFAVSKPVPNLNLLDRFLITMKKQEVKTVICFNKLDNASLDEIKLLQDTYKNCGCQLVFTSASRQEGIDEFKEMLQGKTSVLAGPSGVGKSTILNLIHPQANMKTGTISEKIERGKHTTRHSELFCLNENTYIFDTPGFSSLFIEEMEKEELKDYYPEFYDYQNECRFLGCAHIHEPSCAVKESLLEGKISKVRYDNYVHIFQELSEKKRY